MIASFGSILVTFLIGFAWILILASPVILLLGFMAAVPATIAAQSYLAASPRAKELRRKVTALVTDDDPITVERLLDLLEGNSVTVHFVKSGAEAIKQLSEKTFDIVFMDMVMPGLNGEETISHAEGVVPGKRNRETPVVFFTHHESAAEQLKQRDWKRFKLFDVWTKELPHALLSQKISGLLQTARTAA